MAQPTDTRQPNDSGPTPGPEPAEGRPDMELPGADQPQPEPPDRPEPPDGPDAPESPDADLPQRLGERIANGPGTGIAAGEPDLVPDVEVPDETM